MSLYALVENGEVKSTGDIPVNFKNTGGFNLIKNPAKYKEYGFLPYTYTIPEYDPWTQALGGVTYKVDADKVVGTREVISLKEAVIDSQKAEFVAKVISAFNQVLYNTDWVYAVDSNLDEQQLLAYSNLRASIHAGKQAINNLANEQLSLLAKDINTYVSETYARLVDFSAGMSELQNIVNGIGA